MRKTVSSLPWIGDQQAACQAEGKEAGEAKRAAVAMLLHRSSACFHGRQSCMQRPHPLQGLYLLPSLSRKSLPTWKLFTKLQFTKLQWKEEDEQIQQRELIAEVNRENTRTQVLVPQKLYSRAWNCQLWPSEEGFSRASIVLPAVQLCTSNNPQLKVGWRCCM